MGTEEETRRTAEAFGASLATPGPRAPRRLLALDMDGVMVDGDPGFMNAVAKALAELVPGLPWMDAHYLAFKHVAGFNNDYRVCAAALALAKRGELDRLWTTQGTGFPDLEERVQALEPGCADVVASRTVRAGAGQPPGQPGGAGSPGLGPGGAHRAQRRGDGHRVRGAGFHLPAVAARAPHLRKPLPGGLLQLADRSSEAVVFVGDTRDDAQALRLAREARPTWCGPSPRWDRSGTPSPGRGTCGPPACGPCYPS